MPRHDPSPEDRVPTPDPAPRGASVRQRVLVGACVVLTAAVAVSLIVLGPGIVRGLGEGAPADPAPVTGATREPAEDAAELSGETVALIDRALESSTAGTTSAVVVDPATGERLYARDDGAEVIPASNQKIITELSLFHHAGPQRRLATTVVEGGSPGHLVLVAGGDTLLGEGESDPGAVVGRAGIGTLAARTADAMMDGGTAEELADGTGEEITVDVDTSIFEGPELNDTWLPGDIETDEIGPIAPIVIGSHALPGTGEGRGHDSDAASGVTEVFAQRLQEELSGRAGREIAVTAGTTTDTDADPSLPSDQQPGATELARVESATLREQAEVMMNDSDNRLAEALGRMAAVASGRPGSVDGARDAMRDALRENLGRDVVEHDGMVLADCSGMSPENRVTAHVLAGILEHAARDTTGRYAPLISTFPVSGQSGTLEDRFDDPEETDARGVARAKTGTLRGVTALSGQVIGQNGRPVIAVVLLSEVADPSAATDSADRIFAGLARQ